MTTDAATPIILNGEPAEIPADTTIAELLRERGLDPRNPKGIAVAVGDEVVPKSRWADRELRAGEQVEVITARQGG